MYLGMWLGKVRLLAVGITGVALACGETHEPTGAADDAGAGGEPPLVEQGGMAGSAPQLLGGAAGAPEPNIAEGGSAGEPEPPAGAPGFGGVGGFGDVAGAGGEAGGGGQPVVELGPHVVSVVPADGATGVASNTSIVFSFSETMNEQSVQDAYSSAELGDAVTFAWSEGDTKLTITPTVSLTYAEGGSNVVAKQYTVSLEPGALSAQAEPLLPPAKTTFSTLRRITSTLKRSNVVLMSRVGNATTLTTGCGAGTLPLGDLASNGTNRVFLEWDLTALPRGITSFEDVMLNWNVKTVEGAPAPDLEYMTDDKVVLGELTAEDFDAPTTHIGGFGVMLYPGSYGSQQGGYIDTEYFAGAPVYQVRLAFSIATDNDGKNDLVNITCTTKTPLLTGRYLAP